MIRVSPAIFIITVLICFITANTTAEVVSEVKPSNHVGALISAHGYGGTSTEIIRGKVIKCNDGEPVSLATVTILETGDVTLSDSNGEFELPLPPGKNGVHLFVTHISFEPIANLPVKSCDDQFVEVCLEEKLYRTGAIEVVAEKEERIDRSWDVLSFDPVVISNGAMSQTDPLFSLDKVGYINGTLDFSGKFSVYGSSPEANAFYLDGLIFPSPYHLGGLCSIYDPSNIGSFRFSRYPVSASMLSSTAGVVDIETKDASETVDHRVLNIGVLSTTFSNQHYYEDRGVFTSIMTRRSYLDLVLNGLNSGEGVRIPNFFDVQSSMSWAFDERRYVKLGLIVSGDRSVMHAGEFVESEGDGETVLDWSKRLSALYLRLGTRKDSESLLRGSLMVGWQPFRYSFSISGSDDESMSVSMDRYTLRWDMERPVAGGRLFVGTFTSVFRSNFDINFARGFWLAGKNENSAVRLDNDGWVLRGAGREKWLYSAFYSEVLMELGGVDLRAGARVESFGRTDEFVVNPRFGVRKRVGNRGVFSLSFGLSARDPSENPESPEAMLADNTKVEKSGQLSLNYLLGLSNDIDIEMGGFIRGDKGLLVEIEPTVFSSSGKGKAGGFNLAFERRGKFLSFNANYSYTLSKRIDLPYGFRLVPDSDGGAINALTFEKTTPYWYTSPYEYRHSLSLETGFRVSRSVRVSMKWNYRSGKPYTPIAHVYERPVGGYIASEGSKYSALLPAYSRVDLHVDWVGERVGAFFEVLNITNRVNAFNLHYNSDYSSFKYYRNLPLTPAFGVKIML